MNERQEALSVLSDITRQGAYANIRLKSLHSGNDSRTTGFIHALIYGALEHLLYIDYVIDTYADHRRIKPDIRDVLRLGFTELVYLETPSHAVVSEYVSIVRKGKLSGLSGFVNAMLRRMDRERDAFPALPEDPLKAMSLQYSYPLWIVEKWVNEYGMEACKRLLESAPLDTCIRVQYPHTLQEVQSEIDCDFRSGSIYPGAIHLRSASGIATSAAFLDGRIAIQGEAAMCASIALGNLKGKRILDVCSAPGGKSAFAWSLSEGTADITCWELHPHRVELLSETFSRLHVKAACHCRDASIHDSSYDGCFDAVLADVPCSGLGLLNGKPDLRYHASPEDVKSLVPIQGSILDNCAAYVKPGGILVYSTCTISKAENEGQVSSFLARHPEFRPAELPFFAGNEKQFFPYIDGTEGFFIARFTKCI